MPTLAMPNHGATRTAMASAAARSPTSRASARRSRTSSAIAILQPADEVGDACDAMARAPPGEATGDANRGTRVAEGGGADPDRARPRQEHLDRVGTGHDAAGPD